MLTWNCNPREFLVCSNSRPLSSVGPGNRAPGNQARGSDEAMDAHRLGQLRTTSVATWIKKASSNEALCCARRCMQTPMKLREGARDNSETLLHFQTNSICATSAPVSSGRCIEVLNKAHHIRPGQLPFFNEAKRELVKDQSVR